LGCYLLCITCFGLLIPTLVQVYYRYICALTLYVHVLTSSFCSSCLHGGYRGIKWVESHGERAFVSMAATKLQAFWNHPAGPKTSQYFRPLVFLFFSLYNNEHRHPCFAVVLCLSLLRMVIIMARCIMTGTDFFLAYALDMHS
jgi:hypothetical protein